MFGSMQMAMSRVINLQHHRIAQVNHLIPGRSVTSWWRLHSWRNLNLCSSCRTRMFAFLC